MTDKYPTGSPTWAEDREAIDDRARIPETVTHAEFLAAITPLLTLLNLEPNEVYTDIHVTSGNPKDPAIARISLNVVESNASMPSTLRYGEFGELSVHCSVQVV